MVPNGNGPDFGRRIPSVTVLVWVLVLSLVVVQDVAGFAGSISPDDNPYRHVRTLDPEGKYLLEWLVDLADSRIIFNVTVETRGYVGFGLSTKGRKIGADIVIGGVTREGKPYFSDRHATSNLPVVDESQDWTLHAASENHTHTFLSFSRPFETCDEDDLPIHNDVVALMWAYGRRDTDHQYHFENRGSSYAYLLDPDLTPHGIIANVPSNDVINPKNVQIWTISGTQDMPAKDTTYICSIHKAPGTRKKHIIGFNSVLEKEVERRHIHHFLMHRCYAPEGLDAATVFEPLLGVEEECYVLRAPTGRIPTNYCLEVKHVWAVGESPIFFPEHVGLPLTESPNEYYLLQMHFDNPNSIPGLRLNYALEIFHTERLREHDAGLLPIGELTPGTPAVMIPPSSIAHVIYGHCAIGCTRKMIPKEGIRVFAANMHTHLAGRGIRIKHIRNNVELPFITYDDNYNFNFQQIRVLREELVILPGDMLVNRCVYENTGRNGSVTVGGFSSRHEMCSGFLWYYNKISGRAICRSEIRSEIYRQFLGIYNKTWSDEKIEMVVTAPPENAGLTVSEVGTYRMDWTIENRDLIQDFHRYMPQIGTCPRLVMPANTNTTTTSVANNNVVPVGPRTTRLQRVNPSRRSVTSTRRRVLTSGFEFEDVSGEIRNPDSEFVSIYRRDVVPYERPSICRNRKARLPVKQKLI